MLYSSVVDLEAVEGLQIVDPHWFWMVDKQGTEVDCVFFQIIISRDL